MRCLDMSSCNRWSPGAENGRTSALLCRQHAAGSPVRVSASAANPSTAPLASPLRQRTASLASQHVSDSNTALGTSSLFPPGTQLPKRPSDASDTGFSAQLLPFASRSMQLPRNGHLSLDAGADSRQNASAPPLRLPCVAPPVTTAQVAFTARLPFPRCKRNAVKAIRVSHPLIKQQVCTSMLSVAACRAVHQHSS